MMTRARRDAEESSEEDLNFDDELEALTLILKKMMKRRKKKRKKNLCSAQVKLVEGPCDDKDLDAKLEA